MSVLGVALHVGQHGFGGDVHGGVGQGLRGRRQVATRGGPRGVAGVN